MTSNIHNQILKSKSHNFVKRVITLQENYKCETSVPHTADTPKAFTDYSLLALKMNQAVQ